MHICFVITTPFALNAFVAPVIRALVRSGQKVTVVVNTDAGTVSGELSAIVQVIHLDVARQISLRKDITALWVLFRILHTQRFDIVHSITPKAGLLAMTASRLVRIKLRVHTFTGQVWATRRGPLRYLLRGLDQWLAHCANALLVDSFSQRQFMVDQGITRLERLHVLGRGSISGVDTARFSPNVAWRRDIRDAMGIPGDASVLLYVGRMHVEKGLVELAQSFARVAPRFPKAYLLLVGPDEGALGLMSAALAPFGDRVKTLGLTACPEKYMAAADIFCLPSYREGFGLSLIEAACMGLPCVASRIYGVTDAVVDGQTGFLVPVQDAAGFADAVERLLSQPALAQTMGAAARQRVIAEFSQEVLVRAWLEFYDAQLATLKPPH